MVDGVAVNGCASDQASVTSAASPHLVGTVGFAAPAQPLAGCEYPMDTVSCYQDLNSDGSDEWPNDGGDLVYAEMRKPDQELALGGAGSVCLRKGGPRRVPGGALRLRMEGWGPRASSHPWDSKG